MIGWGYDYAWGRPPVRDESFDCRYVVPNNSKSLSLDEARYLIGLGKAIVSNYEGDGHYEILAGYASGQRCAWEALSQHRACGGPNGCAIYFSVDFDAYVGECASFFQGVRSVLDAEGFSTGAYGSYAVIKGLFDDGLIGFGWQTYAWSGGAWDGRAQLRQYLNGAQYDHDEAMVSDFGQWGASLGIASAPVPHPSPAPVRVPPAPWVTTRVGPPVVVQTITEQEHTMHTVFVPVPLDHDGNGDVHTAYPFSSWIAGPVHQSSDPEIDGTYWEGSAHLQERGGNILVSVTGVKTREGALLHSTGVYLTLAG